MDPNAALEAIRDRLRELTDALDADEATENLGRFVRLTDELVEHVKGLDQWLSQGGFLPAAWADVERGR